MNRQLLKEFKHSELEGNELKTSIQTYAIDKWIDASGIGYCEMFTGMGKTTTALSMLKRLFTKYPDETAIVLVPTRKLVRQWNKRIEQWNLTNIDVYTLKGYCENLISDKFKRKCTVLIPDELHRICNKESKFFSQAIKLTEFEMFFGLSATLSKEHKSYLAQFNIYEVFNISLEEGLELGLVPEYDLYNIPCELTKEEEDIYDYHNGLYTRKLAYFSSIAIHDGFALMMGCLKPEGSKSVEIDGKVIKKKNRDWIEYVANFYNITTKEVTETANICRTNMTKRNNCLNEVKSKLATAALLIELAKLHNKKTVTFTSTTNRATSLANVADAICINSKSENVDDLLEAFEEGTIRSIITNKMFDEGIDDEELEWGINEYFTSVQLSFIQRLGRLLRFSTRFIKKPKFFSLYSVAKDNPTKKFQDKVQLIRAQKGMMNVKYIKNLNEIKL